MAKINTNSPLYTSLIQYIMSIAQIISQDITRAISLPSNRTELSPREQLIVNAYENEAWLHSLPNKSTKIVEQKCIRVDRDLLFQILMVENVSVSKASQIDEYVVKVDPKNQKVDRLRTNNTTANNGPNRYKVITQLDVDESDNNVITDMKKPSDFAANSSNKKTAVYKITLQSKAGDIFFAINTTPLAWISCMLGSKLIIKTGTMFNRGVFILQESQIVFIGGINRQWNDNKEGKMCAYLKGKLTQETNLNPNLKGSRKRKATT